MSQDLVAVLAGGVVILLTLVATSIVARWLVRRG